MILITRLWIMEQTDAGIVGPLVGLTKQHCPCSRIRVHIQDFAINYF
jgi:hypothetical protein